MNPLNAEELRALFSRTELKVAPSALNIGGEITFRCTPPRRVVVHLGGSSADDYIFKVASLVLALEKEWLLIPRYGTVANLGLLRLAAPADAIRYDAHEHSDLARYLCKRPMEVGSFTADLYVISGTGTILATWDHHTSHRGLTIDLRRVDDASRLLVSLNELGAELEVYYSEEQIDRGVDRPLQ